MPNFHSVVSIVELVGVGVVAVAVTIGATVIRRRGGMPLYSEQLRDTDRAARADVWRALKVGHGGDADIDKLARRVATHTLRGVGGVPVRALVSMCPSRTGRMPVRRKALRFARDKPG